MHNANGNGGRVHEVHVRSSSEYHDQECAPEILKILCESASIISVPDERWLQSVELIKLKNWLKEGLVESFEVIYKRENGYDESMAEIQALLRYSGQFSESLEVFLRE